MTTLYISYSRYTADMLSVFPYVFLTFLGLVVGSFLNVVILRFGFSESRQERSHCMSCGTQIRTYDLIPVVSFFILRGKCRSCGSALSVQYPLVELALASLFLLAWHFVPPVLTAFSLAAFVALLVFLSALLALVVYDIRHTLVPMPFIYVLLAAALAAPVFQSISIQSIEPLTDAILGGAVLAGFLYALHLGTRGRGMGMGDVYIAGAAGLLLGLFRGIEALMFAVWIGSLFYLGIMLISKLMKIIKSSRFSLAPSADAERGANVFAPHSSATEGKTHGAITLKTELPFVPFLAVGVLLALFSSLSPLAFGAWLSAILW